ncbi:hypothetical protein D3C76_1391890 [compost metagenome]
MYTQRGNCWQALRQSCRRIKPARVEPQAAVVPTLKAKATTASYTGGGMFTGIQRPMARSVRETSATRLTAACRSLITLPGTTPAVWPMPDVHTPALHW